MQIGGADEDRTRYLVVANDALSQMSYSPKFATQDYQKIHNLAMVYIDFKGILKSLIICIVSAYKISYDKRNRFPKSRKFRGYSS